MNQETEINAFNIIVSALKNLNQRERKRVIRWAKDRFGVPGDSPLSGIPRNGESIEEPQKIVKRERKKKIKDYETALNLFSSVMPKTAIEKVVLMAAYLQDKQGFQEITPYDIGFWLKRIRQGVPHTAKVINEILERKPALMAEIKRENQAKTSRKKLRVTKKGLKYASDLL